MQTDNALDDQLRLCGQEHLADRVGRHPGLADQLAAFDLASLQGLVDRYVLNATPAETPANLKPAAYFSGSDEFGRSGRAGRSGGSRGQRFDREVVAALGDELIRRGKIAAFTVAGGQGTRLGFDAPKGCFPAGAVTGKPLFAFFADALLGVGDRFGSVPPWYIMTSPLNHAETVSFFEEHAYFGLDSGNVLFFPQGEMPSFDRVTGRILLAEEGRIATNPDGHGGSLRALHHSGAIADMKERGVEHISYFQVDNPIVHVIDPVFVGLHAGEHSSGEMSSKMVTKAYPAEKLGVFCEVDGQTRVIEYSDLPDVLANETLADGSLRFLAGSIAIHMIGVEFIERLNTDPDFHLLWHRAEKKVACIDPDTGDAIKPESANAVKLEQFVFDALPLCERSIVLETSREDEFAPIKNATGVDSVGSSQTMQTARAANWLQAAGVEIPLKETGEPDCVIELSPRTASEPGHLKGADLPRAIDPGQRIAL